MSNDIKELFPNAYIEGNKIYPRSGAFEIKLNGNLIYSKFETHTFPTKDELQNILND